MSDYTTVQIVRATIGSDVAGTADEVLARLITAVSRQIDNACNRPDGFIAASTATARIFAGDGSAVLRIDECVAITGVAAKASAAATTYEAWEDSDWIPFAGDVRIPLFNRLPYTGLMIPEGAAHAAWTDGRRALRSAGGMSSGVAGMVSVPTVQVTARWGYAETVPEDIANACVIQTARMFKRGKSAYADTLAAGEFGTQQYRKLDPEVEAILRGGRYIRQSI